MFQPHNEAESSKRSACERLSEIQGCFEVSDELHEAKLCHYSKKQRENKGRDRNDQQQEVIRCAVKSSISCLSREGSFSKIYVKQMFSFDKHLNVDEQINTCKTKGNTSETVSSLTSSLRAKQRIQIQRSGRVSLPDEHTVVLSPGRYGKVQR